LRVRHKAAGHLHIVYVRVRIAGDPKMTWEEVQETASKGDDHSRDIFPIAPHRLSSNFGDSGWIGQIEFEIRDWDQLTPEEKDQVDGWLAYMRQKYYWKDFSREQGVRRLESIRLRDKLLRERVVGGGSVVVGLVKNHPEHTWWKKHFNPESQTFGSPGVAWMNSGVCLVEVGYWTTVAHEIGHAYFGADDAEPGNRFGYGFRVEGHPPEGRIDRWRIPTIMWPTDDDLPGQGRSVYTISAHRNLDVRWIDKTDYVAFLGKLTAGNTDNIVRPGLFITGTVPRTGPMTLGPWFRGETVLDIDETTPGRGWVEYVGSDGSINHTVRIDVHFRLLADSDVEPIHLENAGVGFWVPWYPDTTRVQIRNPWGEIVATREVTPNPPVVQLLYPPINAAVRPGDLTVRWSSSDPDGDSLTHNLLIRKEGSEAWNGVVVFTMKTEGTIPKEFLEMGKRYQIRIMASDGLNTSVAAGSFSVSEMAPTAILAFTIDRSDYTVNGVRHTMDVGVTPTIRENRTLLPIRFVAEPLGAIVSWDGVARKVTVALGATVVELWIGQPVARVNGRDTPIDPANPKVVPIIEKDRSFLPLRFIAESLGADVSWDGALKRVTVTYPR